VSDPTTVTKVAPALSVVVPLFNEEDSLLHLHRQIREACDPLGLPYEILYVDDGSRDSTWDLLEALHCEDPTVRAIKFRRNYGQTPAMVAGFDAAGGDVVVSMDGDLQNDPADIPRLLERMQQGYDVVCGWRKNRQDKFLSRRVPSMCANWLIGKITGVPIHDNGCSLKAYRAATIKNTSLYGEMHRFIPAMSTLSGARIAEMVVNHRAREFGQSKYGLGRVWRVFLDIMTVKMIIGFAARPARWFALLATVPLLLGALTVAAGVAFYLQGSTERALPVSTTGFLLLVLAIQLFAAGIVGELAMRTGDYDPHRVLRAGVRSLEVKR
jgi:glycosyltransferase involved in cell wall biosynthesis